MIDVNVNLMRITMDTKLIRENLKEVKKHLLKTTLYNEVAEQLDLSNPITYKEATDLKEEIGLSVEDLQNSEFVQMDVKLSVLFKINDFPHKETVKHCELLNWEELDKHPQGSTMIDSIESVLPTSLKDD